MTIASENPVNETRRELNRRLNIVSDPNYGDPARVDIPGRDLGIWFAATATILIVAIVMWGGGN